MPLRASKILIPYDRSRTGASRSLHCYIVGLCKPELDAGYD
jgi:hypothetical protein